MRGSLALIVKVQIRKLGGSYTMINGRLYDSLSMDEIGNYDRPRGKFYWELEDYKGIDWNESWSGE